MADRKRKEKHQQWQKFNKDCKIKRTSSSESAGSHILTTNELTVQPLESDTSGKAKKYERTGPQEFVEFAFEEVTIPNIKQACNKHFKDRLPAGMTCDILASDRGPSCTKMSHLPNLKVINIRFIKDHIESQTTSSATTGTGTYKPSINSLTASSSVVSRSLPQVLKSRKLPAKSISVAKSLKVSTMMKLGKVITKYNGSSEQVEMCDFSIKTMSWTLPEKHYITVEENPFATGGFRAAYFGKMSGSKSEKKFVIKRYLESSLDDLKQIKESPECHARKAVQMHALAANFALQLSEALFEGGYIGPKMLYNTASFGRLGVESEIVTIEGYVDGEFSKYINNDGSISPGNILFNQEMAECLTHFSYVKSKETLMLVDIQGSGLTLYDPEIATMKSSYDENDELLFCMGNLSTLAKENFFAQHACNNFCHIAKISSQH